MSTLIDCADIAHVTVTPVRTLQEQLLAAFRESGLSKSQLAAIAKMNRSVVSRSIDDKRAMKTGAGSAEPETMAKALGYRWVLVPTRRTKSAA